MRDALRETVGVAVDMYDRVALGEGDGVAEGIGGSLNAYTRPSEEPIYTVPSLAIAGDDQLISLPVV
jgi:hypothetical protein